MSTPNPLAPQGSLLEKQGRGRSTVQAISFILALHVFVLCALLWGGCKQDKSSGPSGAETPLPGQDGSLPPVVDAPPVTDPSTNLSAVLPPTNAPVLPPTTPGGATVWPPTTPRVDPVTPPAVPGGTGGGVEAPATATATAGEHKVTAGQTGSAIAKARGVSLAALKAANPTVNWNKLKVGQVLTIPGAATQAPEPVRPGAAAGGGEAGALLVPVSPDGLKQAVGAGDTGMKLARKHGVSLAALKAANPTVNWNKLKVGQVVSIPAPTAEAAQPASGVGSATEAAAGASPGTAVAEGLTHTVAAGDTGTKIAKKHGVAWRKIRDLNGLTSDALKPGQKLNIPAKGAAARGSDGAVPGVPAGTPAAPVVAPVPTGGGR